MSGYFHTTDFHSIAPSSWALSISLISINKRLPCTWERSTDWLKWLVPRMSILWKQKFSPLTTKMWSCTSMLRTQQSPNNIFGITQLYLHLEIDASPVWVWFGESGASILTPWLDQIWCPGQHVQSHGPLPQVFWGWLLEHKHMITQVCAHRHTLAYSLKKTSHKLAVLRTTGKKNPCPPN